MVAGARGTLYMRRRAEIVATWPPCPDCNMGDAQDGTPWWCRRCGGIGRVPPSRGTKTAVDTDDGHRRCAYERCQAGGDILPGAPFEEGRGGRRPTVPSRARTSTTLAAWRRKEVGEGVRMTQW